MKILGYSIVAAVGIVLAGPIASATMKLRPFLEAVVSPRCSYTRCSVTIAQIASFRSALNAFEVDNGYYPSGPNGLELLVTQPSGATNWHGPYLDGMPNDPWGRPYAYECPGTHNSNSFDVYSAGPDGRLKTADDITNWQTQLN